MYNVTNEANLKNLIYKLQNLMSQYNKSRTFSNMSTIIINCSTTLGLTGKMTVNYCDYITFYYIALKYIRKINACYL